ncbi:unnamed protein product, partial [Arctogadus glacialis]
HPVTCSSTRDRDFSQHETMALYWTECHEASMSCLWSPSRRRSRQENRRYNSMLKQPASQDGRRPPPSGRRPGGATSVRGGPGHDRQQDEMHWRVSSAEKELLAEGLKLVRNYNYDPPREPGAARNNWELPATLRPYDRVEPPSTPTIPMKK